MTQKQICELSFVFKNPGLPNSFVSLRLISITVLKDEF